MKKNSGKIADRFSDPNRSAISGSKPDHGFTFKPGVIVHVSKILWKNKIHIAGMHVGRILHAGEHAILVLNVDDNVPEGVIEEIRGMPEISTASFVKNSGDKIVSLFYCS